LDLKKLPGAADADVAAADAASALADAAGGAAAVAAAAEAAAIAGDVAAGKRPASCIALSRPVGAEANPAHQRASSCARNRSIRHPQACGTCNVKQRSLLQSRMSAFGTKRTFHG